jgi:hypothetical protein
LLLPVVLHFAFNFVSFLASFLSLTPKQLWRTVSAEEKVPFEAEAKKLRDQYTIDMAKYKEEHKDDAPAPATAFVMCQIHLQK